MKGVYTVSILLKIWWRRVHTPPPTPVRESIWSRFTFALLSGHFFQLPNRSCVAPSRGWRLSKKRNKQKDFLVPSPKKYPAWAGWSKRLRLVWATPWVDFAVITDQLSSTITAISPCVALSSKKISLLRIFVNYCQPKKRPTIWNWVQLLENLIISTPNIDFCIKELYRHLFLCVWPPHS